ncbi:MAG: SufE family protein [Planctomycetaceae bacterium]|nr:SufE family protein [Planctomycetaceae bacterium]
MSSNFPPTVAELKDSFDLFDDSEEKYEYLVELGRQLPEMSPDLLRECNRVIGCMSSVWLTAEVDNQQPSPRLKIQAESDSLIVRGLIVIVLAYFNGQDCETILRLDADKILSELGFGNSLSSNRKNGLAAMIKRIKQHALESIQAET